jgi:cell division protein FtsA
MSPSSAPSPLVVGLDIGTTKICAIVAGEDEHGALSILGVGARPSSGVRRGVVVDVPDTMASIKDALSRASHMAGVEIEGVVAGITGDHILSENRTGSVTVALAGGEIGAFDVERALAATLLEIGRDVEVIHCLPRSFSIDGQSGLRKAVGSVGSRLEVEAHVVMGQSALLRNTLSCVTGAGVRADALVLEPLATAEAVSTRAERDLGVLVLDIGGGTSDLAAFVDGSAIYSAALPVGGNHVTRDISIGLSTPFEFAETLKVGSGAATRDMIPHGEALEVMTAGGASRLRIPRALLGEIIEARMRELFELSLAMAVHSGLAGRVPGGLILSGGGSLLPGALELAGKIFGLPVRLGVPEGVVGWSEQVAAPQFSTAVGLCRFALAQQNLEARRNAMILPHARRVWSLLPPGVVLARSVVPQPDVPAPQRQAPPVSTASSAPASEEFPAQLQFAPTPQEQPETQSQPEVQLQDEPDLAAPVVAPVAIAPVVVAPPEEEVAPLVTVKPSAFQADMSDAIPVLAMRDDAAPATSSAPKNPPAPEAAPAPRPVEAEPRAPREAPVRSETARETTTRSDSRETKPRIEVPRETITRSEVAREVKPRRETPAPVAKPEPVEASTPMGLPAPREGGGARSRLQNMLARASAMLDSPPPKEKEVAHDKAPEAAPVAGDSRALHWWLRFKTFIGFGED